MEASFKEAITIELAAYVRADGIADLLGSSENRFTAAFGESVRLFLSS